MHYTHVGAYSPFDVDVNVGANSSVVIYCGVWTRIIAPVSVPDADGSVCPNYSPALGPTADSRPGVNRSAARQSPAVNAARASAGTGTGVP